MGGLVCGEGAVLVVSECAVLSSFECCYILMAPRNLKVVQ